MRSFVLLVVLLAFSLAQQVDHEEALSELEWTMAQLPHHREKRFLFMTDEKRIVMPPGSQLVLAPTLALPFLRWVYQLVLFRLRDSWTLNRLLFVDKEKSIWNNFFKVIHHFCQVGVAAVKPWRLFKQQTYQDKWKINSALVVVISTALGIITGYQASTGSLVFRDMHTWEIQLFRLRIQNIYEIKGSKVKIMKIRGNKHKICA